MSTQNKTWRDYLETPKAQTIAELLQLDSKIRQYEELARQARKARKELLQTNPEAARAYGEIYRKTEKGEEKNTGTAPVEPKTPPAPTRVAGEKEKQGPARTSERKEPARKKPRTDPRELALLEKQSDAFKEGKAQVEYRDKHGTL